MELALFSSSYILLILLLLDVFNFFCSMEEELEEFHIKHTHLAQTHALIAEKIKL